MAKKLLIAVFGLSIVYWLIFVSISGYSQHPLGIYTQIPIIIMATFTGLWGISQIKLWGGFKTTMGKAVMGLSSSELFYGIGFLIWTWYIFSGVSLPYPSFADYAFVLYTPAWLYGIFQLSRAMGISLGIRDVKNIIKEKVVFLLVIIVASIASYYLSVNVAHQGTFSILRLNEISPVSVFNLIYNYELLIQIVVIAMIYTLSRSYLGGIFKTPILIIFFGFLVHYIAMLFFAYGTTTLSYFNGDISDLLFTIGIFLECFGILNLDINKVVKGNITK